MTTTIRPASMGVRPRDRMLAMRLGDAALIVVVGWLAMEMALVDFNMPDGHSTGAQRVVAVLAGVVAFSTFLALGVYRGWRQSSLAALLRRACLGWSLVWLGVMAVAFALLDHAEISRNWVLNWLFYGVAGLVLVRGVQYGVARLVAPRPEPRRVAVVGQGPLAAALSERVRSAPSDYVIACVADIAEGFSRARPAASAAVAFDDLLQAVERGAIDEVWLTRAFVPAADLERLMRLVRRGRLTVRWVPGVTDAQAMDHRFEEFLGLSCITFNESPTPGLRGAVKAAFDRVVAVLMLAMLSPLMGLLWWLVSRDGGPALYGHERIGQDGRRFKCLKFRSMAVNSDELLRRILKSDPQARAEWERDFKLRNDPRVTRIGALLRRTSLDELPQLINVLRGEMSLVGPRPVVAKELDMYKDDVVYYLAAKPGMTGLWQVSGRNDVSYDDRVRLDSYYVKHWSLWFDCLIMLRTVKVMVFHKGAY